MARPKQGKPKKSSFSTDFVNPIKKPNTVVTYEPWQLQELKRCAEDIFYFIQHYVYIVHPTKGRVIFKLYPYQRVVIENFLTHKNNITMISRQMGKSACSAAFLLWLLIFKGEQTALVVSNIHSAAIEIVDRFRYSYEYLPDWLKPGVEINNRGSMMFDNKSRIVTRATTKNSGRGLSPTIVYCDEFGRVDLKKQKDFWSAIKPTLSTGGKCIITSTPNSDEDVFAQIWQGASNTFDEYGNENLNGLGRNGFKATLFTWEVNPERDAAWEKEERASMPEDEFEREHNCRFIGESESLIDPFKLSVMQGKNPEFSMGTVRWWQKPEQDKTFLVALDPAKGTGRNYAAIQVFQLPEFIQIAEWQHNRTAIPAQVKLLREITKYIKDTAGSAANIYWSVENNSIGEAANSVIFEIGEENVPGTYLSQRKSKGSKTHQKGFYTGTKSKLEACMRFKSLVERDKITINSKVLVSQLKNFVANGASYSAKSTESDDLVSATLIIVRMLERIMSYEDLFKEQFQESVEDKEIRQPMFGIVSRQMMPIIQD